MDLPVEVIQHIFSFLSPCEIVRLRKVSKKFQNLTHSLNRTLWKDIYARARLLLPPGPFYWQSTRYLRRTLVQSELVSKTWTSQPLRELSHTSTSWKQQQNISWAVVFGRWCIFLQGKAIQCHDIDLDTHHLLYDGTAHHQFQFTASTATDANGERVYLLLVDYNRPHQLIKLLGFHVDSEGFSKPEILDLVHTKLLHEIDLTGTIWHLKLTQHHFRGSTPFLALQHLKPCLVFDIRTHIFYILPSCHNGILNETQTPVELITSQVFLTKTHIITIRMSELLVDVPIFIQAFVTPDLATPCDRNDIAALCLTHEVAARITLNSFSLLRNSVVDPVTGAVNIRLLNIAPTIQIDGQKNQASCLDLTLPKPVSTTDILPITIRSHYLFESVWSFEKCTASDDGYLRGLLLICPEAPNFRATSVCKFMIDASGEECTATVSDPFPVDFPGDEDEVVFDGTRGRIHCFEDVNTADLCCQVVTVDLA